MGHHLSGPAAFHHGAVHQHSRRQAARPLRSAPCRKEGVMTGETFLSVRNLSVGFGLHGAIRAVRDVSFDLEAGKTLCLVGESGSGKSVTAASIMGLHKPGSAKVEAARLRLAGVDLLGCQAPER